MYVVYWPVYDDDLRVIGKDWIMADSVEECKQYIKENHIMDATIALDIGTVEMLEYKLETIHELVHDISVSFTNIDKLSKPKKPYFEN